MDYEQINKLANSISVLTLVLFALISGARKKWTFYWSIDDKDKQITDLKQQYQERIDDLDERLVRRDAEYNDLMKLHQDKFLPAFLESSRVIQELIIEKRRTGS